MLTAISGFGIVLALAVMAVLVFKKVSPVVAGPIAAVIVCVTSNLNLQEGVLSTYLSGVGSFVVSYFFVFLLGNIFGNIYQITGAASRIGEIIARIFGAKRIANCMLAVMLSAAALSYGGINSFVIVFAVFPIALKLFEEADLPLFLLAPIVYAGICTFAMTGPFAPQICNIVSMNTLGTSSYAGLIPGLVTSVAMAVLIVVYMTWRGKKAKLAGLHFTYPEDVQQFSDDAEKPNSVLCFIPLLFIVFTFNVMSWAIEICLALGIIIAICLFWKHIPKSELLGLFNSSAASSVTIILNTAAIVGYGAVAKLTPCYSAAVDLLTTSEANPYVLAAVGANIFVCILGSSSGGISLMYASLGDTFLHYGTLGYNLGFIHRLCAMGSGGLDTMPWNGGVISVFGVCKTTLKDSYKDTFVTSGLIPLVCTLAICLPLCIILT